MRHYRRIKRQPRLSESTYDSALDLDARMLDVALRRFQSDGSLCRARETP
jgi:hypothetical protein